MRTLAVLGSVAALGLAVAGLGTSAPSQPGLIGKCAKANLDLISEDGKLTLATDNPRSRRGGAARRDTASSPRTRIRARATRRGLVRDRHAGSASRRAR